MNHVDYIDRCIEIAKKGEGWVNPNPMVGCVIVNNGEIISEGYHRKFGENHAERNAILPLMGDSRLKNSTLYVTLEPCSHQGKTPPCANLIIDVGIPEVVISMLDPNPLVAGNGIKKLEQAGVKVTVGVGEKKATLLNKFFLNFYENKKPYVTLKWAESSDHFIGKMECEAIKITDEKVQKYTHKLRKAHSAILVGVNTWINDQPQLTDRFWGGPQPIKIILDPNLRGTYENAAGETWVFNSKKSEVKDQLKYINLGENTSIDLNQILDYLYSEGINSVLVEGGKKTLEKFIEFGLFNEVHRFINHGVKLQNGISAPPVENLKLVNLESGFKEISHLYWDNYTA